ncbi:carbamoyl-phosphate synthase (glutamine-hydrolyzing) large subunit [Oxyplasma meridianum]|uniref:Carbamoyl-phosphate synthase (Glutamine-hydrolyzing) large subunit n=1 Tax=Oxyplasma meridianum TaxID=3073602 RepID=A0AAX4NF59_9ARCH
MPRDKRIKRVLVIGSGPVVIGQAAEFDYAGSQACMSLKEDDIQVVLLNSNPATIQTDYTMADRIYMEPMNVETIKEIISRENIDSILPTMGGQTALNLAVSIGKTGLLNENLRIIGTPLESIMLAENRDLFHKLMLDMGEPVARSWTIRRDWYYKDLGSIPDKAVIVRTSFSLGGTSGSIFNSKEELFNFCRRLFTETDQDEIDVEESIAGLKEIEYEIIRDNAGNCIIICNMENLDPMGVHTGESIVVTPSQTLSDIEYHMLRDAALRIIGGIGIRGACNIQFALDSTSGKYYVVEVNPRTSRSSALASKATGYPIARISTKIALGYNLTEILNPITRTTYAAFEPSLDYVTVKIPRWPFDKFSVDRTLGVQMKSIGEVMGIGRTFEEALMKAIASLDNPESRKLRMYLGSDDLDRLLSRPSDLKIYAIFEAIFRSYEVEKIIRMTGYDGYFIYKIANIVSALKKVGIGEIPENISECKSLGIPDSIISSFSRISEKDLIRYRIENGITPCFRGIDTCSGEFQVKIPYLYSTYFEEDESSLFQTDRKKIMVLGSGPNRISQGLEFDYGAVKAVQYLRKSGYYTIMVNCNPETVSTDFDISDKLYFEPLTIEHISNIIHREKPDGLIIQFSGQTGQNISLDLAEIFGEELFLGTKPSQIVRIEERTEFSSRLEKIGIRQPGFVTVRNIDEMYEKLPSIGLPVIVRSSFIIGGRSMDIVYEPADVSERLQAVFRERPGFPVLISRYIDGATEMDVDFVSNGKQSLVYGISVHIEEAGTHSGDATMVLGPDTVNEQIRKKIFEIVDRMTIDFSLNGLSNLQIAVKDNEIYVIELNARSSRSVPFVSRATGKDLVGDAVNAMITGSIEYADITINAYFVKVPIFPFNKFSDLDSVLGPEMKSTGEGIGIGMSLEEAIMKSMKVAKLDVKRISRVLITVNDFDKEAALDIARDITGAGGKLFSTPGTHKILSENGIESTVVYRVDDVRKPSVVDVIVNDEVDMVINTPTMLSGAIRDGFEIRRHAIRKGLPVLTNIRLAHLVVASFIRNVEYGCLDLNEYRVIN